MELYGITFLSYTYIENGHSTISSETVDGGRTVSVCEVTPSVILAFFHELAMAKINNLRYVKQVEGDNVYHRWL